MQIFLQPFPVELKNEFPFKYCTPFVGKGKTYELDYFKMPLK